MIGFSLYPHHLRNGSHCTLSDFCSMIAQSAEKYGVESLGVGSDLCQDQPDSIVEWMRVGRWSKTMDYGEGSADNPGFPKQPDWFADNRGFKNIAKGLRDVGFDEDDVEAIMGKNWYNFYANNFVGLD